MVLYVSRSTLGLDIASQAIADLVAGSIIKNQALAVTGALIFTGQHFAQLIEGGREEVDALMAAIARDPRHRDVAIIAHNRIEMRRFPTWSLAYAGPSRFVSGHITRMFDDSASTPGPVSANRLIAVMEEFSRVHARPSQ